MTELVKEPHDDRAGQLERESGFKRDIDWLLDWLDKQLDAGRLAGITMAYLHEADNDLSAYKGGHLPRSLRVRDVDRLRVAVECEPNLNRMFRRGFRPGEVPEHERRWIAYSIRVGRWARHHDEVTGMVAVIYLHDGRTVFFSRTKATPEVIARLFEVLSSLVEDGSDIARCALIDEDKHTLEYFTPSAEADQYAREMGDKLKAPICSTCGVSMRLHEVPQGTFRAFSCLKCMVVARSAPTKTEPALPFAPEEIDATSVASLQPSVSADGPSLPGLASDDVKRRGE
jgi:hypothetical protein